LGTPSGGAPVRRHVILTCGFGAVGPLSCDKEPLDAGEVVKHFKPSSGLSREHGT